MDIRAVLASIRPMWCEKIFDGSKTYELRKTAPGILPPFKSFVYCTKAKRGEMELFLDFYGGIKKPGFVFPVNHETAIRMGMLPMNGMVIGEFICDEIRRIDIPYPAYWSECPEEKKILDAACLSFQQAHDYLGRKTGYAWHIRDPILYEKPKKLSDFKRHDPTYDFAFFGEMDRTYSVSRPPQSWCYIDE